MSLTHIRQLQNPNYIGAYSLQPNEERVVTITKVVQESVVNSKGESEPCAVIHLKDEKPFILNATNRETLIKVFETPYVENWIGKSFVVYAKTIKAFGGTVDALRIKPIKPPLPELTPDHPKWGEAVKAVKADPKAIEKITARFSLSPTNLKLIQV